MQIGSPPICATSACPSPGRRIAARYRVARAQHPTVAVPEQPHYVDLVRTRLAQGSVIEPQSDSALHYLNQLKATDPQNVSIAPLSNAVQAQILAQAREALEASLPGQTEALLQIAASLGPSPEADALRDRCAGRRRARNPRRSRRPR